MSKVFILSNTLRKCEKRTEKDSTKNGNVVGFIILGVIICAAFFFFGQNVAVMGEKLENIDIVFPAVSFLVGIAVFMMSVIRLINSLYMSSDLSLLTAMPFSSFELAFVRFINASYLHFGLAATFIIPFTFGYCIASSFSFSVILMSLLGLILVPIFSMSLASILIILVFAIFRFARNKNLFSIIGVVFSAVVCVAVSFINMRTTMNSTDINQMIKVVIDVVSKILVLVPPAYFLGQYSISENVSYIFLSVLVTAVAFFLFYIVAKTLYLKGALAMQTTSSRSIILNKDDLYKATKPRKPVKSYMKKEIRTLTRTPGFLINSFLFTFIWPVIFLIPMLFGNNGLAKIEIGGEISQRTVLIISCSIPFLVSFVSSLNFIGSSSISREGKSFYYMKIMPMTYHDQIKAKRNTALMVLNIGTTIYICIGTIVLTALGIISPWGIIYGVIVSFLTTWINVDFQIIWSVKKVNLDWDNEAQAQNTIFPLIEIVVGIVASIVIAVVAIFFVVSDNNILLIVGPILITGILLLTAFITNKAMYKYTRKKLNYLFA